MSQGGSPEARGEPPCQDSPSNPAAPIAAAPLFFQESFARLDVHGQLNLLINGTCREAICYMIETEGHEAEGAPWSELIWTRLEEKSFDAVLLDLDLGGANGLELLRAFQEAHADLPVVLVASEISARLASDAMRRGALDLLEKPFRREHLIAMLARLQRFRQLRFRIERLERNVRESLERQQQADAH